MRRAELGIASVLAILSIYLMWKSMELPIGWRPGVGPGGGAFPFWLSAIMLVSSVIVLVRGVLNLTPESRSEEPFIHPEARRQIFTVVISLGLMIAAIHWVGVYVSVLVFMLYYLRIVGKHSWITTLSIALSAPVVTFLFFEKLLLIILPKGITDEFFYIFY